MQVGRPGARGPLVVGVTGGFASGKSTVTAVLAQLGAAVVDADAVARELSQPGGAVWQAIREAFGQDAVDPASGMLRRAWLRQRIFTDPQARRQLDAATHPPILAEVARRVAALKRAARHPVIAVEIPLLFEAGEPARRLVDRVLVVWAPEEVCRRRAMGRGLSEAELRGALAAQWPLERKRRLADAVVDNGGTLEATRAQVEALWRSWVRSEGGADRAR